MTTQEQKEFKKDVHEGLSAENKYLSSRYLYDQKGDALFQQIMQLPEYYLTQAEHEIIQENCDHITQLFTDISKGIDIIELGAGDGYKTKVLLTHLLDRKVNFTYIPIDISQNALDQLKESLQQEWPKMDVQPKQGRYLSSLKDLATQRQRPKLILVLGSNIGNLTTAEAEEFMQMLSAGMGSKDFLFMGFDIKKDPIRIQEAYADSKGITQEFNRNILHRINRELGGNFVVKDFEHWESYNPESGQARSYLLATKQTEVKIDKTGQTYHFNQWETIHTEISQKYNHQAISSLARKSTLLISAYFSDKQELFRNYIFKKKA